MDVTVSVVAAKVQQLTPLVRRLTAPNPSFMTGPGTNTYIVGKEQLAVIDPGPLDQPHIDAILELCEGKLKWIIATHTHPDHSPAAAPLAKVTGAEVMGNVMPDDGIQDTSFSPSKSFTHNEVLKTPEFTLRALHTPGHVDNHVCFLLEEEKFLLAGDHMMNGSTVVIVPPGGRLKEYLASLKLVLDYPVDYIGPAHGDVFTEPKQSIEAIIAHRLKREEKVIKILQAHQQNTIDKLLPDVYDDVDSNRHQIAKLSLEAHLIKLQDDGLAEKNAEHWVWKNKSQEF